MPQTRRKTLAGSRYRAALVGGRRWSVTVGRSTLTCFRRFWATETASSGTGPSVFSQPPDSGKRHSDSGGADLPALSVESGQLSQVIGDSKAQQQKHGKDRQHSPVSRDEVHDPAAPKCNEGGYDRKMKRTPNRRGSQERRWAHA